MDITVPLLFYKSCNPASCFLHTFIPTGRIHLTLCCIILEESDFQDSVGHKPFSVGTAGFKTSIKLKEDRCCNMYGVCFTVQNMHTKLCSNKEIIKKAALFILCYDARTEWLHRQKTNVYFGDPLYLKVFLCGL